MPDFDSMSPEEIMAWMETLAERQGATEGFTSDKRLDVPEVDPNSIDQSQFGEYIPHGMDPEKWRAMQAGEEAKKQAALAARKQQPVQPTPELEEEPEYMAVEAFDLPPLEFDEDAIETVRAE